jgi:ABC-type polysaccharide transport system permease subunit
MNRIEAEKNKQMSLFKKLKFWNSLKFRKTADRWQLYVLLLPALVYILLFAYRPMYGVLIAF